MEKIRGYIEHIIYRNTDNGYTVFELVSEGERITCVGGFKVLGEGETIEAEGEYTAHPVYGEQFKIERYRSVEPDDVAGIKRYLGSGAIKGIGEALALRIVDKFGDDTFRIIEEEPERLAEVKGISERKAQEIATQVYEKKDAREAMTFLGKYGISGTLSVRIYEAYGMNLYGIMKENPYQLAEDIDGVGFKIADGIAAKIGISIDSDYRIRSGLLYVLMQAGAEGNCYLPESIMLTKAVELLGVDASFMEPQIQNLAIDKKIVIKLPAEVGGERKIYAASYYYAELNCARMLKNLNISIYNRDCLADKEQEIIKRTEALEKELNIGLDELQKKAVCESVKNGVMILSGGPGTGKTTAINMIIRYFMSEEMDIFLAAPTGRAAKRMTETTGYEAKTIHRMLELNGAVTESRSQARFEKNEENPLEADVIIIDEMSMVDIFLFQSLLRAIPSGTRLIMVGDANQLPSVGPGQVLKDLLESGYFPTVVLEKIFRQAKESDIVLNAHLINAGQHISLDNKSRDFFFLPRNDVNVIYKHMIQLILEKLPPYVGAPPYDIQVLTPMRKGKLGVETLNGILQKYLNPPSREKKEYLSGDTLYREKDKVMQVKNNYQLEWEVISSYGIPIDKGMGVFNGDVGMIVEINEYTHSMVVEYDEHKRVTYQFAQLDEIELAYAVTIHKAQGSEYPAVIMPLLSGPKLLFNRNLLYTGVTRARNCVTILGSKEALWDMIDNNYRNGRYSGLAERIGEFAIEE